MQIYKEKKVLSLVYPESVPIYLMQTQDASTVALYYSSFLVYLHIQHARGKTYKFKKYKREFFERFMPLAIEAFVNGKRYTLRPINNKPAPKYKLFLNTPPRFPLYLAHIPRQKYNTTGYIHVMPADSNYSYRHEIIFLDIPFKYLNFPEYVLE